MFFFPWLDPLFGLKCELAVRRDVVEKRGHTKTQSDGEE